MNYRFSKNRQQYERLASDIARADKSDPFARARVLAHMRNGIAFDVIEGKEVCCYAVTFRREQRTLSNGEQFSDGSNTYITEVAGNMARP